jgi:hypothetical protein
LRGRNALAFAAAQNRLLSRCGQRQQVLLSSYYVSTTGNDVISGGSFAAPFRTIGYGLARMQSGDTLIVMDGVYQGQANFINDGRHAIADGTAVAPTKIRALDPFRARIQNVAALQYYDSPLRNRGQYIQVDGFVFELRDTQSTKHAVVAEIGQLQQTHAQHSAPPRCGGSIWRLALCGWASSAG